MWTLSALLGLEGIFGHDCPHSYVQLSCYDQAKQLVHSTGYLRDNIFTHFVSSFIAVSAPHGVGGGAQFKKRDAASFRPHLEIKFTS